MSEQRLSKRDYESLERAAAAGIRVVRQGMGWRFVGPGCDVMATCPRYVTAADLVPDKTREHGRLLGERQ